MKNMKKLFKNKKRTWHHYAFVYDKNTVKVYRDGKPCNMTIDFWEKEYGKD